MIEPRRHVNCFGNFLLWHRQTHTYVLRHRTYLCLCHISFSQQFIRIWIWATVLPLNQRLDPKPCWLCQPELLEDLQREVALDLSITFVGIEQLLINLYLLAQLSHLHFHGLLELLTHRVHMIKIVTRELEGILFTFSDSDVLLQKKGWLRQITEEFRIVIEHRFFVFEAQIN